MEAAVQLIQLFVGLATLLTLVWGLIKMFSSAREARATRAEALAASIGAEQAAIMAARHAETARQGMDAIAENVQKVELATNSMKDALVKATADASFAAGEKSEREKPKP